MDLLSLVLTLKPIPVEGESATRVWWGRAAHELLLSTISARDAALAASLHEGASSVRPFTVSTLMGRFAKGVLLPDENYALRLTAFHADAANLLFAESTAGALRSGQVVELDYKKFEILAAMDAPSQSVWAKRTSYQDLSAPFLLSKEDAPRRLTLQLTSPTTFKSAGKHVPVPLPTLVFGSLLERWNAFAPVAFPPEVKRYAEECLAISKYDLQTKPIPQKGEGGCAWARWAA
jgi:CRISPR-associated endoribonuclease Cas6